MTDMFRLDGKVAVVIGGGGGIGELMAEGMAERGAKIAIASRNMQKLADIAKTIHEKTGSEVAAFKMDITDERSVIQCAKDVVEKFGTVDILVNSQGLNIKRPAAEFPPDEWDQMFAVMSAA
jgi:gluconate 5-dehydrogenase